MRQGFAFLLLGAAVLAPAQAQQYSISTVAGGSPPPTPAIAVDMPMVPKGITTDTAGNVYFISYNCVFKLDLKGGPGILVSRVAANSLDLKGGRRVIVSRLAGNSRPGYSGDGGLAIEAGLLDPTALAVDAAGNLFIAGGERVRKVSPDGIIITVAGNGIVGASGDGGLAPNAQLANPEALAVDSSGDLFIAEGSGPYLNSRVRKVFPSGIIATFAGGGTLAGSLADGGNAASAQLLATSLAVDSVGNLFIADARSRLIRKVSPDGIIRTVAGNGAPYQVCVAGASTDGRPATAAELCQPSALAVDSGGNLLIADTGLDVADDPEGIGFFTNFAVLKLAPGGTLTTLAGNFVDPWRVVDNRRFAVDSANNLFFSTFNNQIQMLSTDGGITTVAGSGQCCYYHFGDAVPATSVQLDGLSGLAAGGAGDVFILQSNMVRRVSANGIITTAAQLSFAPYSAAADAAGNLFLASNHLVFKLSRDGGIATVAGNGTDGDSGDGARATDAQLTARDVAVDSVGNLFIADYSARKVRRVSPDGIITTVAGNGKDGFSGDGGPATNAQLTPFYIVVDGGGNLFISDLSSFRIRKVSPDGTINTIAGNGKACFANDTFNGDGGPATRTNCLNGPIAADGAGNLLIDTFSRIRRISPAGILTTIAGTGAVGYSGDGGLATDAQLRAFAIAADRVGNVYISNDTAVRVLRPIPSQ